MRIICITLQNQASHCRKLLWVFNTQVVLVLVVFSYALKVLLNIIFKTLAILSHLVKNLKTLLTGSFLEPHNGYHSFCVAHVVSKLLTVLAFLLTHFNHEIGVSGSRETGRDRGPLNSYIRKGRWSFVLVIESVKESGRGSQSISHSSFATEQLGGRTSCNSFDWTFS